MGWVQYVFAKYLTSSISERAAKCSCLDEVFMVFYYTTGIVGEVEDGQDGKEYYLWTHRRLDIGWNKNQVRLNAH